MGSNSPQVICHLSANPSRCITNNWFKLNQVTMSVSPSETSPSKTSREDSSALMRRTTQLRRPLSSMLKSLSLTTQTRSEPDTHPSLIATLATPLANSTLSKLRLTEEPVRPPRRTQNSSNLVMPLWSSVSQPSQCASRLSPTTHP